MSAKTTQRKDSFLLLSEQGSSVAEYYGFQNTQNILKQLFATGQKTTRGTNVTDILKPTTLDREGRHLSFLNYLLPTQVEEERQPVMFYTHYAQNTPSRTTAKDVPGKHRFVFEIIGLSDPAGEAILLRTALSALQDAYFINLEVHLNSVGDKNTSARFIKEAASYYRRHAHTLHATCRKRFRLDPWALLSCENERCRILAVSAPKPIGFLSEQCRSHLKQVLEYTEAMNIPYSINDLLTRSEHNYSRTIFEIRGSTEKEPNVLVPLGYGGRYDSLSRKFGLRKDIPALGLSLILARLPKKTARVKNRKPRILYIQIGAEARRQSFGVVEALRKANISIRQQIGTEKLSNQLAIAESNHIPITVIMGQKEAIEHTVIVRDTQTRSQQTIPADTLIRYVKRLKG